MRAGFPGWDRRQVRRDDHGVPVLGAAMGHMTASAAENQVKVAQGAARMQSRMAQGMQMMAFMPKLMRGQRLIELGTARKCEWATGVGTPEIPNR
jgi:hypothetical protein